VTPFLSILKRLMFQLPLLMALSSPYVIVSALQAAGYVTGHKCKDGRVNGIVCYFIPTQACFFSSRHPQPPPPPHHMLSAHNLNARCPALRRHLCISNWLAGVRSNPHPHA
jgi:hypothetical protein